MQTLKKVDEKFWHELGLQLRKERQKQGLEPLDIGLYGLTYRNRIANTRSGSTGWLKHTLVFKYTYTK